MSDHLPADARPLEPDKSLGELFAELGTNLGDLVSTHIDLAKAELKQEVSQTTKIVTMFGSGAFAAYMAVLMLSLTLAWLLAEWLPTWVGFALITVIWAIAAAVLIMNGRTKAQALNPVPQETVDTIKEDVEWAKHQKS